MQNQLTIKAGPSVITCLESQDSMYPGVSIEVNGVQVAVIEHQIDEKVDALYVWDGSQEDYLSKTIITKHK